MRIINGRGIKTQISFYNDQGQRYLVNKNIYN